MNRIGINVAGAEFGEARPGVNDRDYHWPTVDELGFYRREGVALVRIPFLWERMQRALLGELDAGEVALLRRTLDAAGELGLKVIPECHNYGRYAGKVVEPQHLADLWKRLGLLFRAHPALEGYGLMNEPHDMGAPGTWFSIAQAAVSALREVDRDKPIFVAGDSWSSAERWPEASGNLAGLVGANLVFEAHCYLDRDGSGKYANGYDATSPGVGVLRLRPFIDWLKANKLRGFIGEFGVPGHRDARWLEAQGQMLDLMAAEGLDGTVWAGGSWWPASWELFLGKVGEAGNANWSQIKSYLIMGGVVWKDPNVSPTDGFRPAQLKLLDAVVLMSASPMSRTSLTAALSKLRDSFK